MAYGTPDQVAQLARVHTRNGVWLDSNEDYNIKGTNPTLSTVTTWLENISAQMDIALGSEWFVVPLDSAKSPIAYKAVSQYVCGLVADLAHLANGIEREVSPLGKILSDMTKWVQQNADGLVQDAVRQQPSPSTKRQASFRLIG
jgi:hypothetical protein